MVVPITSPNASSIIVPDVLRHWPWPRYINPHYIVCKKESSEWCEGFRAFSPDAQAAFNKCDFNLLGALAYPLLDKDGCRIACDLMNLFFVIDEHTDASDSKTARAQADIVMDAIRNPHTPRRENEWVGGRISQQFWLNAIKSATASSQRRFVDTFQHYMDSVVQQAIDRGNNHIRDIPKYFEVRRGTIGLRPSYAICELYMNIPDEVLNHPVIEKLTELSIDMVIIGNDIYSYKVESDRGDASHNLVGVVMHQFGKDPQAAMDYISDMNDSLAEEFLNEWTKIPTFEESLDLEVRAYCYGLGNWVRANDSWSLESERYFGKQGLEVQATRRIQLNKARPLVTGVGTM